MTPHSLEHAEVLKNDLRNDELGLPIILRIHASALTSDIAHAIIVCDGELLKVSQQFVPLLLQPLDMSLQVDVLMVKREILSIKPLQFIICFVKILKDSYSIF